MVSQGIGNTIMNSMGNSLLYFTGIGMGEKARSKKHSDNFEVFKSYEI